MNRRRTVIVLVALLAVAGIALWRAGIRRVSAGTIQPDVNSLALLPAQTTTVFGLDLDGLRSTPVYALWRQRMESKRHDKDYDEFVARTGFDPQRDLEAVTGGAWTDGQQPAFLAVVTARYNRSGLAAFLKEKGALVATYRGFELLGPEKHQPRADRPSPALVLLDDRTILAGTEPAVRQAIDLKLEAGGSVLTNQALLERVRRIGRENQLWAVSSAPGAFLPQHVPPLAQANIARVLRGLEGSTFAVNATAGLNLLMEGTCASEEDARTLADAARGVLAMLRLAAPADRPEALEVLNSFRVEQQERQVRVTAQLSWQLLDELAEKPSLFLPRHREGAAPHQHKD